LHILDSDIAENEAANRKITHQLYAGGSEIRILQEIVLGIGGGVHALRALNHH
jgi:starch phosphorylase